MLALLYFNSYQHQANKDDIMNKNIIDTVWDDIGDLET